MTRYYNAFEDAWNLPYVNMTDTGIILTMLIRHILVYAIRERDSGSNAPFVLKELVMESKRSYLIFEFIFYHLFYFQINSAISI